MTAYNPQIIEKYAAHLYKRAGNIIWKWGCIGMLVGAVIAGFVARAFVPAQGSVWAIAALAVGVLVGLYVGRSIGTDRAFSLYLEAQTALCQVAIERNTRRAE